MSSTLFTHVRAEPMDGHDPARALCAIIRMALAVPDSIDSDYFDEIGQMLYPCAQEMKMDQSSGAEGSAWPDALTTAESGSFREACIWLGRELSEATDEFRPFYLRLLHLLEERGRRAPHPLASNIAHLASLFGLDAAESAILALTVDMHHSPLGLDWLKARRPALKIARVISAGAELPIDAILAALQPDGRLAESRLFKARKSAQPDLHELLGLSSFGRRCLHAPHETAGAMVASLLAKLDEADGDVADEWAAAGSEHQAAQVILRNAVQRSTPGINILLHGAAGSGKSAFARHLARMSQGGAYAVPQQDGARGELPWSERFARLELAQRHGHGERGCVLVFDEADGALDWYRRGGRSDSAMTSAKERMKRLLGANPHPVVWVLADTEDMDADCLSQFTFCVAFEPPRAAVRRRIVKRYLAPVGVTDTVMSAVARHRRFSVDLVSASARVAQLAGSDPAARDEAVMCHMNGHAKALQLPAMARVPKAATRFDTGYLHVDGRFTAAQVLDAVVRNGAGKILMNGPPGTGKTQLGNQIAERLDRELLYLTASNINSKWYGESERNVANLFTRCNPAEQVIFLDEAETVLGAREDAGNRASETVVAEFLRQLEPFPGVFICATNHAWHVDAAMIRRFTFRLEFKPLTLAQRQQLLCELAAHPANTPLPDACQAALVRLDGLTPGDYANVKNRFELLGHAPTLDDWIAELQQEWTAKPNKPVSAGIGFL